MTDELIISDYTSKSFIVMGDTIPHSSALTILGGQYTQIKIGNAWLFSMARKPSVELYIETGEIMPYQYPSNSGNGAQSKPVFDFRKIFNAFFSEGISAFDPDSDYVGRDVKHTVSLLEEKYLTKIHFTKDAKSVYASQILVKISSAISKKFKANVDYTGENIINIFMSHKKDSNDLIETIYDYTVTTTSKKSKRRTGVTQNNNLALVQTVLGTTDGLIVKKSKPVKYSDDTDTNDDDDDMPARPTTRLTFVKLSS